MGDAEGIGNIITGGLIAREFDTSGTTGRTGEGGGGSCLNCGAVRAGPFCQQCGQNGQIHRTLISLARDLVNGILNFEGKFWQTLPLLALHPGDLTRRYIHGQRVSFISPMALFLFSVFLLFAAVSKLPMPDIAGVTKGMAQAQDQMAKERERAEDKLGDLKEKKADKLSDDPKADVRAIDQQIADTQREIASLKIAARVVPGGKGGDAADGGTANDAASGNSQVVSQGTTIPARKTPDVVIPAVDVPGAHMPARVIPGTPIPEIKTPTVKIDTGLAGLNAQIGHIRDNPELYAYKLQDAASKYSWAMIPISLPFIWLLFFWRRDVGLYDHAIFAIHSLSFMMLLAVALIALDVIGVSQAWLWVAFGLIPPIHIYKHLKYAYLLGRVGAVWRTGTLLVFTSITSTLFFLLILWMEAEG